MCDMSPDDHVDVVPVHVGAVPRPLGPHRPVGGLGEGPRAAGAANQNLHYNENTRRISFFFTFQQCNLVVKWRCSNDLRLIMTKGLQTVTSICQDTTEVQYTRRRIEGVCRTNSYILSKQKILDNMC